MKHNAEELYEELRRAAEEYDTWPEAAEHLCDMFPDVESVVSILDLEARWVALSSGDGTWTLMWTDDSGLEWSWSRSRGAHVSSPELGRMGFRTATQVARLVEFRGVRDFPTIVQVWVDEKLKRCQPLYATGSIRDLFDAANNQEEDPNGTQQDDS